MCHQASFHLKFARKSPLLTLKLPENQVVFKTGSSKKRRCGIIPKLIKLVHICSCSKLDQQATATFSFKKDDGRLTSYCSEITKGEKHKIRSFLLEKQPMNRRSS